jgi:serine phosphatase RsbU (regulator of sigma subunit)
MVNRMSTSALPGSVPWYRRHAVRWVAMSRLPNRKLRYLYLAVFSVFAIFGPYLNIQAPNPLPFSLVVMAGVVNGLYSVLYPWLLIRKPWSLTIPVGIFHAFLGAQLGNAVFRLAPTFAHLPLGFATSRPLTANMVWLTVILSYSLFLGFIRNQASEAIRIQNELDLAHGIQQTLVPLIHRTGPLYEVYGITRPSERVGGDLVDLIPARDGDIAYVADVAGHGLQAGILMGMLKAAARTALLEPSNAPERLPLLLDRLDNVLPSVKESHMYAAFAALQLGPQGRVRHALAGHPPVLHYCHANGTFCELSLEQFPLGLVPDAQFAAMEIDVAPGDLLLIATDGILETCNPEDREFGTEGLRGCVESNPQAPLPQLAANILATVAKWGKQQDDQTLLLVRCISNT